MKTKNILNLFFRKINKLEFPFIRMGNSGDPSEDWEHTLNIIEKLKGINKQIVIITKHFNKLDKNQLERLKEYDVCINTSISSVDENLHENIEQYEILKKYCKSVLRCVSFDFNNDNLLGRKFKLLQEWIFINYEVLDTVFRCSKSNKMYKDGLINIKETKFLGDKCYVSKYDKKTYFGKCNNCIEKCGINM